MNYIIMLQNNVTKDAFIFTIHKNSLLSFWVYLEINLLLYRNPEYRLRPLLSFFHRRK